MATLETKKQRAKATIDVLLIEIAKRQKAYFENNGEYWQGSKTPISVPKEQELNIDATIKKTDQPAWADFLNITKKIPFSITVDAYNGEKGHGYTVKIEFDHYENHYERIYNFGPEKYRQNDWQVTTESDGPS